MAVKKLANGENGPVLFVGQLVRPDLQTHGLYTIFDVGVTRSRRNSLEHAGGHHLSIVLVPDLTWQEASKHRISGEDLAACFRSNVTNELLGELFPAMSASEVLSLHFRTLSNDPETARNPYVHAHAPIAPDYIWKNGLIHQLVDDARSPRLIAMAALVASGMKSDEIESVLEKLYPPKK